MRQLLTISFLLIAIAGWSQSGETVSPPTTVLNPQAFTYPTMGEAVRKPMDIGSIFSIKGQGYFIDDTLKAGEVADSITTIPKPNGHIMRKDMSQAIAINVSLFGFVGDGVTDNYAANQKLARFLNRRGGNATINFEPGDYYIGQYKIQGGANANTIQDITYTNIKNVHFIGNGAKISVRGNFNRAQDNGVGSYENSVVPFQLINPNNTTIEGFELDGNVDQMTKAAGTTEGIDYGIQVLGGNHVTLRKLYIHHFATDGIYVANWGTTITKNTALEDVASLYNARQGMSVIQAVHLTATNCKFDSTGVTGAYGVHAPGAGVDVEPNFKMPAVDDNTRDINFLYCEFAGNAGPAFISAKGDYTSNVTIQGGVLDGTSCTLFPQAVWMAANSFTIKDAYIKTDSANYVYPSYGFSFNFNQSALIDHCTIESKGSGLVAAITADQGVRINNCIFIGKQSKSFRGYFPDINAPIVFSNNTIVRDSSTWNPRTDTTGLNQTRIRFAIAYGNRWVSNLDTTKTAGKSFGVLYSSTSVPSSEYFPVNKNFKPVNVDMPSVPFSATLGDAYSFPQTVNSMIFRPGVVPIAPTDGQVYVDTTGTKRHAKIRLNNTWVVLEDTLPKINYDSLLNKPLFLSTDFRSNAFADPARQGGGWFNYSGATGFPTSGGGGMFYQRYPDFTNASAAGSYYLTANNSNDSNFYYIKWLNPVGGAANTTGFRSLVHVDPADVAIGKIPIWGGGAWRARYLRTGVGLHINYNADSLYMYADIQRSGNYIMPTINTDSFKTNGIFIGSGLQITAGSPSAGMVLKATGSAGYAAWSAPYSLTLTNAGISGTATYSFNSSTNVGTLNIPVIPVSLWNRSGTTISPINAGDNVSTTGNGSFSSLTLPLGGTGANNTLTTSATNAHLNFTDNNGTTRRVDNWDDRIFYNTPADGGLFSAGVGDNIVDPAGALSTLTITLPSASNGDKVAFSFTQAISTITFSNGTLATSITSATAGSTLTLQFFSTTGKWYKF